MSLAATLSSRFALLLTGRTLLLLLGLAVTAILTRSLGPEGFGHYRAAVAYLSIAVVLADLGLTSVFVREISQAGADQARIVGSAIVLRLTLAVVVFVAAVAFAFALNLDTSARTGIVAGAAGFVAYSLHLMLFGLFQQRLRQHGVVLAEVLGGLALLAGVVFLSRAQARPALFVAALATSYLLTLMISLLFARRLVPFRLRVDLSHWRRLMRSALPLALTGTLAVLYVRADSVLLALLSGAEMVGLYGVPVKIFDSAMGVSLLLTGLFAPLFAESASTDAQRFSRHVEQGLTVMATGAVAAALTLNAVAREIVVLLGGSAFADADDILRVLSLFLMGHALSIMLREAAVALHIQRQLLRPYAMGAAVAFACYIPLITLYGGVGAAAALIVAEIVVLSLILRVVQRAVEQPISLRAITGVALSGLTGALALVAVTWLGGAAWARLGAALGAYAIMLCVSGALRLSTLAEMARGALLGRSSAS
jgi:O-antigen/teichoic acid export membrane protein